MLSHGNSSTSAASFSNGLKELRYSIARCIVAMRVRQTTGNVRVQCAEVGKKTTPSRDSPFYNDRTRSDDTRCLTESESLLALEDNELLPSCWGGSRRSGSLCQPAQQRFVKQYGIYATGPNRSEAPGLSRHLRRCLVRPRRGEWRDTRQTRSVAARLSGALWRAAPA